MSEYAPDWCMGLRDLIAAHPEGISEFNLLGLLDDEPDNGFEKGDLSDSLNLFQTHFLLFHSLYRLQQALVERQEAYLEISALCIRLHPLSKGDGLTLAAADPLRDYYLDLTNLEQTGAADVEALLGRFWQRYLVHDRRAEFLAVLELADDAGPVEIRQQYRRLAMQHHPDRGGDHETLQRINTAYAALMGK